MLLVPPLYQNLEFGFGLLQKTTALPSTWYQVPTSSHYLGRHSSTAVRYSAITAFQARRTVDCEVLGRIQCSRHGVLQCEAMGSIPSILGTCKRTLVLGYTRAYLYSPVLG